MSIYFFIMQSYFNKLNWILIYNYNKLISHPIIVEKSWIISTDQIFK